VAIAITDGNRRIIDVNYAFIALFGYTKEELTGKTALEAGLINEQEFANIREELEKSLILKNVEINVQTKKKEMLTVLYSLTHLDFNGKVQRIITIIDITEKKKAEEELARSEEKYRLLFQKTPLPTCLVDLQTQDILDVNEAAVQHYGFSREEFLHMNARDLRPTPEIEHFNEVMYDTPKPLSGNMGIWQHWKKDGTIIDVEVTLHQIYYQNRPAYLVLANDVTEKLKQEKELKLVNKELHELSAHLQNVREEERINIAREIHDELGQQLTGLKMDIFWINKKLQTESEAVKQKITGVLAMIDETVKTVRRISSSLRPSALDDLGLVAALEWQSQEVEKRSEIKVNFMSQIPEVDIPLHVKTGLFRIYQEALTNAVRHANAHEISSQLQWQDNRIILEVKDNGKGMGPESNGKKTFGLLGIKERTFLMGGRFEIKSLPGAGTTIMISIPVERENAES
jgi:two-component system sensor histidine kinase UhpB